MKALLDTHVVLWWQAGGKRLSRAATRVINGSDELLVSPLTCWEITTLARLGRVRLDRDAVSWIQAFLRSDRVGAAPLTPEGAAWAGQLPDSFPGDPIDRLLYATARDQRVPFVTKDRRLHAFARTTREVDVIW
jgi:PIN domain nuclease of toxin-antitoxin system